MPFGNKTVKSKAGVETASPPAAERKPVKVDFNEIWALLIRPALQQARCRPYRADEEVSAGDIRTDMFFELVTGEFVLADISTLNANVFYELGVRHGISPRGVLMVDGGWDRRPFDVAPDRTFSYRGALFEPHADRNEPSWKDAVKQEVEKLAERLQAAVASDASTISSPVYKELSGLKPVDWGQIQNAKARYFGSQLQDWHARVRKAKGQSHVGDILTLSRDAPNRFVEWRLRLDAARALSDLGRFEPARELLRAMVTENPTCPETRFALAGTLDRLARMHPELQREYHGRAELEIQEALSRGGNAPQAHRLLGRLYKCRWRQRWENEVDESTRRQLAAEYWETAKKSLSYYQQAQMRDLGCFHAGLNVVSLSRLQQHLSLKQSAKAAADLADVTGLVRTAARRKLQLARRDTAVGKDDSEAIWATATLGEVALLTNSLDDARTFYQRAVTHPDVSVSQLKAFDDQLAMYEKLGFEKDCVAQLRSMVGAQLELPNKLSGYSLNAAQTGVSPRVFVFRGESFDEPEFEDAVRARLKVLLQGQWEIREGDLVISSARRGAEILFAEECVRRGANVCLLLPLPRAEFVTQAVRKSGSDFEERFYHLVERCEVLEQPVRLGVTPEGLDPYERNNIWCLDIARTELGPKPKMRPRVLALSVKGEDHPDPINQAGSLKHFERCAHNLDLLVERIVVWSAEDEPTWFPTANTLVHVRRPNGKTDTLSLDKELRLGRAGDNDVVLDDRSISRHHLKLELAPEGVQLTNVSGHPNATFLDGMALDPGSKKKLLVLTPDQTIRLVDGTEITFEALRRSA
jgi:tetratricopeptide (TPR) repeat protein